MVDDGQPIWRCQLTLQSRCRCICVLCASWRTPRLLSVYAEFRAFCKSVQHQEQSVRYFKMQSSRSPLEYINGQSFLESLAQSSILLQLPQRGAALGNVYLFSWSIKFMKVIPWFFFTAIPVIYSTRSFKECECEEGWQIPHLRIRRNAKSSGFSINPGG